MLPPLDTPEVANPAGRTGVPTLIRLVAELSKFIVRNQSKIRAWLVANTTPEMVALFDQLVDAIEAFTLSLLQGEAD